MSVDIRRPADETGRPFPQPITSPTAASRLIAALEANSCKVNQTGTNTWMGQCPAHPDRTPSLAITQIEGSVLVYCHAGCPNEAILDELSLNSRDFYDNSRGEEYPYRDVSGRLARTVFRSPAKKFRQEIIIKGVVPLYHLDRVLEAVRNGDPLYIPEGEKDVHAGESQGVTATTAPGGAANWAQADYGPLRGAKNVHIVADRDEPGFKRAAGLRRHLKSMGVEVDVLEAAEGKDLADHIAAGRSINELVPIPPEELDGVHTIAAERPHQRELILTPASDIKPRRVLWLWEGRIAVGTLALLAGLQGLGKSTLAYWIASQITLGTLPGEFHGTPRSVLVCATEDSWEHTIVPRFTAAGADLTRVFRVEVLNADEMHLGLALPRDIQAVEKAARKAGAAALFLDPLISRLGDLDTHKDSEVRQALEPLVAVANRASMAIVGLIHHNKSGSADPLHLVMGSTAFSAVARSVHTVIRDPEDDTDTKRLFGTPKNNLGRTNLPTLSFTVESHPVDTDEGTAWTGRIDWRGEHDGSIADAMRQSQDNGDDRSATKEACDWLEDHLTILGGSDVWSNIKREGSLAGHSESTLKRAKNKLKLGSRRGGFPRSSLWFLNTQPPVNPHSDQPARGDGPNEPNEPNGQRSGHSAHLGQSVHPKEDLNRLGHVPAGTAISQPQCNHHPLASRPDACSECDAQSRTEQNRTRTESSEGHDISGFGPAKLAANPDSWPTDEAGLHWRNLCEENNVVTVQELMAIYLGLTENQACEVLMMAFPGRRF